LSLCAKFLLPASSIEELIVCFLCRGLGTWSPDTPIMLKRRPFSKLTAELEAELDLEPEA
jgi:hypothetical protein